MAESYHINFGDCKASVERSLFQNTRETCCGDIKSNVDVQETRSNSTKVEVPKLSFDPAGNDVEMRTIVEQRPVNKVSEPFRLLSSGSVGSGNTVGTFLKSRPSLRGDKDRLKQHSPRSLLRCRARELSPFHRWLRAFRKARSLSRGLCRSDSAHTLFTDSWLEASDAQHRYGHYLSMYHEAWLHSSANQDFFYWLDSGKGKDLSLEGCPRELLESSQVTYLNETDRMQYEVVFDGGLLRYKASGELLTTTSKGFSKDESDRWIFVFSPEGKMYVGLKEKGRFHHSSFLSGASVTTAGRLCCTSGKLLAIAPHSGHYKTSKETFMHFLEYLESQGVNLSEVHIEYEKADKPHKTPNKRKRFRQSEE
eukprot:Colp12_sorted_trinity150504_noHs@30293